MNPLEWAKAFYGVVGAKYPTASLIGAMVLGALVAGAVWLVAGQQYEKTQAAATTTSPSQPPAPPVTRTGNATATGAGNVANTGDGNKINSPDPTPK